jgi:transcription elongation factor Elf1
MTAHHDSPHPALPRERGREKDGPALSRERGRERKPRCPFCKSDDTEVISLFGSQVMTMQCKCHACGSFFEASKY